MLDIRISRLVQMVNVLNVADDVRRLEIEWQTKLVAGMVANTVEDPKGRKELLKHLDKTSLLDPDSPLSGGEGVARSADTTDDSRTVEDIMQNGSVEQALARNNRRQGPGVGSLQFTR